MGQFYYTTTLSPKSQLNVLWLFYIATVRRVWILDSFKFSLKFSTNNIRARLNFSFTALSFRSSWFDIGNTFPSKGYSSKRRITKAFKPLRKHRQTKYLNNTIEFAHGKLKSKVNESATNKVSARLRIKIMAKDFNFQQKHKNSTYLFDFLKQLVFFSKQTF